MSNLISHPKSDGFGGDNPNPTDSDFFTSVTSLNVPLPFPFGIPFPQERHVTLRKNTNQYFVYFVICLIAESLRLIEFD
jgi:hypothetical protein